MRAEVGQERMPPFWRSCRPRFAQLTQRVTRRCLAGVGTNVIETEIDETIQVVVGRLGVRRFQRRGDPAPQSETIEVVTEQVTQDCH